MHAPNSAEHWTDWITKHRWEPTTEGTEDQCRTVLAWMDAEMLRRAGRQGVSGGLDSIDVGCGSGWLCQRLQAYGAVTGTDLAVAAIEEARRKRPGINFVAGDFMALDFPREAYDVVVTLEVLSHVADQPAFVAKLASLLKPGGLLIVGNQNRFVLERNHVGDANHRRKWTTRRELRDLLQPHVAIERLTTLTPMGDQGILRWVNARKITRAASMLLGPGTVRRLKERLGFGWTVMATGRKR